jgi:hypothetical protein
MIIPVLLAVVVALLSLCGVEARGQEPVLARFRMHNAAMNDVQPSWMGPLIQSDPRLAQAAKLSVSDAHAPGAQLISYGNNRGVSVVAMRRFQFDVMPPSFFRNHSAALPDGFGNAATQVKYRIASGNAEHGNYAVTAILAHGFAPRAEQNGMMSAYDCPKLAAGKAFGRFNVQSVVSGVLPLRKVSLQGRVMEWNVTGQVHPTAHTWLDVENNAAYFFGGPFDGKTQNFMTPSGFYMVRRAGWEPTHPVMVFGGGMQIATSRFHTYDHNLVAEMRVLF